MRTLKPACLSVLTRSGENGGDFYLGVSVLTHIPLQGPPQLGSEQTLWPLLGEYAPAFIEEGVPRSRSELLLYGNAYPPSNDEPAPFFDFGIRCGDIAKRGRVFGQRVTRGDQIVQQAVVGPTKLGPETAYGGPDYPNNLLGTGHPSGADENGYIWLPLIESLNHPWSNDPDLNHSLIFGQLDVLHPERNRHAGTFDDAWLKQEYPGMPVDSSWEFFNTAAPDQRRDLPFEGIESYDLINLKRDDSYIGNSLPRVTARVFVQRKGEEKTLEDLDVELRTLVFLPEADRLVMIWQARCITDLEEAQDIDLLLCAFEHMENPKSMEHYTQVINARLDEEDGVLAMLDDAALVPKNISYDALLNLTDTNAKKDPDIMSERLRRRIERSMQEGRTAVEAKGLDPDVHAPPAHLPPPPVLPPLPEIASYLRDILLDAEQKQEETKAAIQKELDKSAAIFKEQEMDFKVIVDELNGSMGPFGPPQPFTPVTLEFLADMDRKAREDGEPLEEVQTMLNDKKLHEQWAASDQQVLDGYKVGAHHQPPAPRLSGKKADDLRRRVIEKIEKNEGLRGLDLTGADLAGCDLSGVDCSEALMDSANLFGTDLSNTNFSGAVLAHADLSNSRLRGSNFTGANLGKATLDQVDATGACFSDAELAEAVFSRALLKQAHFKDLQLSNTRIYKSDCIAADFTDAMFYECDFEESSFAGALLDKTQFIDCKLSRTIWRQCKGSETVFFNASCSSCDFTGARLPDSRWIGAVDLQNSKFDRAQLSNAYFGPESNLQSASFKQMVADGADFSSCNLESADLSFSRMREAGLRSTCLRFADMQRADLMHALLTNADLRDANLTGAHFYGADLARIKVSRNTRSQDVTYTKARTYPRLHHAK